MSRSIFLPALFASTLALSLPTQASGLTRTFVSAGGSDSNPCTIAQPCATFATAYAATAANGIIAALDPGKYGPLTITGPITINGNGWAAITAPAAGNGITVNAGSGNVTLTGLNVDGAGAGYNGIVFNSGSSLTITNCVLQNFAYNLGAGGANSGDGILIQPTSGTLNFVITNTTVANNLYAGIIYLPGGTATANGTIDHVVATSNVYGIFFSTQGTTGGSTAVTISDSIAADNTQIGIYVVNGTRPLQVSIDNTTISNNQNSGIYASTTANVLLGRSVITGNIVGVTNSTSPNTFYTYKDNRINLNGTDGANTLNTTLGVQ